MIRWENDVRNTIPANIMLADQKNVKIIFYDGDEVITHRRITSGFEEIPANEHHAKIGFVSGQPIIVGNLFKRYRRLDFLSRLIPNIPDTDTITLTREQCALMIRETIFRRINYVHQRTFHYFGNPLQDRFRFILHDTAPVESVTSFNGIPPHEIFFPTSKFLGEHITWVFNESIPQKLYMGTDGLLHIYESAVPNNIAQGGENAGFVDVRIGESSAAGMATHSPRLFVVVNNSLPIDSEIHHNINFLHEENLPDTHIPPKIRASYGFGWDASGNGSFEDLRHNLASVYKITTLFGVVLFAQSPFRGFYTSNLENERKDFIVLAGIKENGTVYFQGSFDNVGEYEFYIPSGFLLDNLGKTLVILNIRLVRDYNSPDEIKPITQIRHTSEERRIPPEWLYPNLGGSGSPASYGFTRQYTEDLNIPPYNIISAFDRIATLSGLRLRS